MSAIQEIPTRLYTAEELERLPADSRYELIQGELVSVPPDNGAEHGNITLKLSSRAAVFVEDNALGECFAAETRFVIEQGPDTAIGPDFAFVARERLPEMMPRGYLRLAPDIVLETRSPGDIRREVALKVARWLNAGVRIVWSLDPAARTLTVHRAGQPPRLLTETDTLAGEDVLPGFTFPLRRLFPDVSAVPHVESGAFQRYLTQAGVF